MRGHEVWRYFGGGCGGDPPSLPARNGRLRYHPVVVVNALAKVTDQLFGAGNAAARCDHENACTILQEIEGRHSMLSRELLAAEEGNALCQDLATDFRATYELLASIS